LNNVFIFKSINYEISDELYDSVFYKKEFGKRSDFLNISFRLSLLKYKTMLGIDSLTEESFMSL
jgi:hypothetical protein